VIVIALTPTSALALEPLEIIKRLIQINNINNTIQNTDFSKEIEIIGIKSVENIGKQYQISKAEKQWAEHKNRLTNR
jgi:hypothetical protein|tara:strand:- start:196 stop:426 length:231 start_codon:yes stop_codon:yes gene_type:complete